MSITKHNAPDHVFEPDAAPEMPRNRSSLRFERSWDWTPTHLGPGLSKRLPEAKAERKRVVAVFKYLRARQFHQDCLARARAYPDLPQSARLAADLKAFWRQQWLTAHEWV